jgi:hypothetical protein
MFIIAAHCNTFSAKKVYSAKNWCSFYYMVYSVALRFALYDSMLAYVNRGSLFILFILKIVRKKYSHSDTCFIRTKCVACTHHTASK